MNGLNQFFRHFSRSQIFNLLLGLCLCCLTAVHLIFCKCVVSDMTGLISLASVMYFSMGIRCDVSQNYLIIPASLQQVCLESPCSTNISSFCLHGTLPRGHFFLSFLALEKARIVGLILGTCSNLSASAFTSYPCPLPLPCHCCLSWLPVKWLIFSGIRWHFLRLML